MACSALSCSVGFVFIEALLFAVQFLNNMLVVFVVRWPSVSVVVLVAVLRKRVVSRALVLRKPDSRAFEANSIRVSFCTVD